LGAVELDPSPTGVRHAGVTPEEHAQAIWTRLRADIVAHLRADGHADPDKLRPSGLGGGERPTCARLRDELLAEPPEVTVIIPTRERPEMLRRCLGTILAGDYPADRLQVLVVDNRPDTDDTRHVVEELGRVLPVTYLREDRSGSASARNRGLSSARGEIVAFTDDDAMVDRRWISQLVIGFRAADDVACVTGLLLPRELETPAQVWFEEYGGFTRGFERRVYDLDGHRPADQPLYPYSAGIFGTGNNMAFERAALVEMGGFDPALGNGTPALGGVDSEVLLRTVVTGHRLVYEPSAIAYHSHRPDYAGLRRQIYGYGVGTSAYLLKTVLGNPRLLPDFARKLPRGLVFALSPRSDRNLAKRAGFPRELTLLELWGMARGPLAYARSRRRYGRHSSRGDG
jgi:glycosyltransferase involved in cell wall biosynthesis